MLHENHSLKSGKTKQKQTNQQTTRHPIVCFHPFLDTFKRQLGWGRGRRTASRHDFPGEGTTSSGCQRLGSACARWNQTKPHLTQGSNSPHAVCNTLTPRGFVFLTMHFCGHSLVLRFKFSLLGYCALLPFENTGYASRDVLLRNKA